MGDFFGGDMGRGHKQRKGRDISTEINISFEEAVFGVEKTIILGKQSVCDTCNGSGAKHGTKLETCKNLQNVKICNMSKFATCQNLQHVKVCIMSKMQHFKNCNM